MGTLHITAPRELGDGKHLGMIHKAWGRVADKWAMRARRQRKRTEARALYRSYFRLARKLEDPVCRWYVEWRARMMFKKRMGCPQSKVTKHLRDARQQLSILKRAARGDRDRMKRVVNLSYGFTGKLKHMRSQKMSQWTPRLSNVPPLIRLMCVHPRASPVMQAAIVEHIASFPRPIRRCYVDVLGGYGELKDQKSNTADKIQKLWQEVQPEKTDKKSD